MLIIESPPSLLLGHLHLPMGILKVTPMYSLTSKCLTTENTYEACMPLWYIHNVRYLEET